MKRKRFTEEQIIGVLKEHELGAKTADLCRKYGNLEWLSQIGRNRTHSQATASLDAKDTSALSPLSAAVFLHTQNLCGHAAPRCSNHVDVVRTKIRLNFETN
jgi:hypothetical protein